MSARRIAAALGRADRPHLWPFCGGWACTRRDTAIAPTALLAWLLLMGGMGEP